LQHDSCRIEALQAFFTLFLKTQVLYTFNWFCTLLKSACGNRIHLDRSDKLLYSLLLAIPVPVVLSFSGHNIVKVLASINPYFAERMRTGNDPLIVGGNGLGVYQIVVILEIPIILLVFQANSNSLRAAEERRDDAKRYQITVCVSAMA
jgi:hypothetical protein